MEHFKAKLLDSFNDPTIVIRQIHLLGPKGIKVKLTDQVVENIANETIYECQLIQGECGSKRKATKNETKRETPQLWHKDTNMKMMQGIFARV